MGAFGDNLRRERELRGITLAEISESTKIARRWLQALEEEKFELLPGGVFNRGFVRAYARFLGINEDETVADYIAASNERPPAEDRFPLEVHEKPKAAILNPKRSVVPVVLAVVALVGVVSGWTLWMKHRLPPIPSALANQSSSTSAPVVEANMASTPSASSTAPGSSAKTGSNVRTSQPPALNQDSAPRKDTPESPTLQTVAPAISLPSETSNQPISVIIKARKSSWISIAADGRSLWQGTLGANNERSAKAGKKLVVKTGNAAGIDVSYNGKALGILGKDKEVRTLTFNAAGLQ